MKKKNLIIIVGIFMFSMLQGQDIPSYILPEDAYNGLDDEAMQKIISLSNEMKNGVEPSFESVSCIFPHYMDYPKAIVGIKEHHGRFLTSWDGSIIFPPFYLSFKVEGEGRKIIGDPIPFSSPEVKKLSNSLIGDYLPVVNRKFEYQGLVYDQTVLAYSKDFSTESPLIAFVRMTVKNAQDKKKTSTLSVCFKGTGVPRSSQRPWATSGYEIVNCPMMLYSKDNKILNENGDAIFWTGSPEGVFGENRLSFELSLEPNEEKELYFCTPFDPVNESIAEPLSKTDFDETYGNVKKYWDGIFQRGMAINVPEKIVNNAYNTWRINNFLLVQEDIIRMTYKTIDAPFFYEGIFGYAAAMYLNTITTAGYYEEAKRCAKMFLRLQHDDGGISGINISNGIIPHQHGAILYTISQIYRMGRDKEWFADIAPDLIKGCNWIIRERSKTKKMENGEKTVTYGMLPPYRYNVDTGHGTQEYLGNAWCWAGLNQVAIALRGLGGDFKEESNRLQKEADLYKADIFASMKKATIKENDLPFLPIVMTEKKPYEYLLEDTESIYYDILSCRMLESGIFDTTDERIKWIPDFLESRKGIILGITRFYGDNKLGYSAHFSAGYGITNLRMGRIDRFLLNFYSMLSYGMARNLYATQEHDNFIIGRNDPWYWARQPHLHSTSELIRITNNMLLHEEPDEIWLARGVPRKWLENGKIIEVKNAQTCFGPLSYNIESNVAKGIIKAGVTRSSSTNIPSAIKLSLRHPEGKAIARVEVNGKTWKNFGKDIVNLPGSMAKCDIVAYY
ncbi:MAG: hypothetical protein A2W92_19180 [Bacteroidetes bacterium GWA2_42_15]|nr:MAG: hypothetical protein A2W92_19180 [Bacteroidetes bacterium GWA2_42_15]